MDAPPMTRCECAGLTFAEIAALARREGIEDFELLRRRTGCASTCTACRPELRACLDARPTGRYDACASGVRPGKASWNDEG
ncbi:MAG: bacterioferritin-associated ferredoxin [Planctomycetota bacterium]